ncbi:MAG: hypothetical protein AAGD06_25495 [Acidobacteriota bacterium]
MSAKIHKPQIAVMLLLSVLFVGVAYGQEATPLGTVVGSEGTVLQLRTGSYGGLFPSGTAASPDAVVLALDVTGGDSASRLLVPETSSRMPEIGASIFYEEEGDVAYLLWEGLHSEIHPLLYLTSFDGERFGEVYEISGSPFSRKGHPHLVVSRDSGYSLDNEPVERLIAHVTWTEEFGADDQKRYAPLVFVDGRFLGRSPVEILGSAPKGLAGGLSGLLRIQDGPQKGSFVAGFVDGEWLVSEKTEVVPHALSRLADHILELLEAQPEGAEVTATADLVRTAALDLDLGIHPASLDYLVDQVEELILASQDQGGLQSLGGTLHATIIHIGMRVGTGGLASVGDSEILTVRPENGDGTSHQLKTTRVGQWAVPEVGPGASLFLSVDGEEALFAWDRKQSVVYRETRNDGSWSAEKVIQVEGSLDREMIYSILESRARNR